MLTRISHPIKVIARRFGIEIRRIDRAPGLHGALVSELNLRSVGTVFDIGANVGQFASALRQHGFRGRIVSVEPLPDAHAELTARARADRNWLVHPRGAVARSSGSLVINVARNSVSSSPLPMLPMHEAAAPESRTIAATTCVSWSLDEVVSHHCGPEEPVFIKIDTQGFESEVLAGGAQALWQAQGLLLEMSLVPLYEGQVMWRALVDKMANDGLHLWRIDPAFIEPVTGQTLQVDGTFLRARVGEKLAIT